MAKPILTKINTYDARDEYIVSFTYSGHQTYRHRFIITNASTSAIVYDKTVTGFELFHKIEENSLQNGEQYYAQVQCFDKNNSVSELSSPIYFTCVKMPTFCIQGVKKDDTINVSSIQPTLLYRHDGDELLKDYQFFLYDSNKTNIMESPVYYDNTMSCKFTGLEDGNKYYLRAVGETVHGLKLDTDYINFKVVYKEPSYENKVVLKCDRIHGFISWMTNIVVINCTTPKAYTYDSTNQWINLIDKEIEYNSGFMFSGDFQLKLIGKNLNRNGKILTMSNGKQTLTLGSAVYDTDGNQYFTLKVENGYATYARHSNDCVLKDDDIVEFIITRQNNLYKLSVFINNVRL